VTTLTLPTNERLEASADPSVLLQKKEQRSMMLLLIPALAVVTLLLVVPMAWLFLQSFYSDGFTLEHYQRIFTESIYWNTFALTFKISFIVTILALLMGYPVAYAITRLPRRWSMLVLAMVIVPFWTSVLVRAYAWLVLLQRSGIVNDSLLGLGLIDNRLSLVHNELGTIIATVHILLPFMVLPLYATMQKIPGDLLMAASSLGANRFMVFWRVFVPLSISGVVAGCTLVFVLCLGFYITPELMGGGRTVMASMLVSRNIQLFSDWGAASAVSVVLLLCVGLIFYVVGKFVPVDKIVGGAK